VRKPPLIKGRERGETAPDPALLNNGDPAKKAYPYGSWRVTRPKKKSTIPVGNEGREEGTIILGMKKEEHELLSISKKKKKQGGSTVYLTSACGRKEGRKINRRLFFPVEGGEKGKTFPSTSIISGGGEGISHYIPRRGGDVRGFLRRQD